MSLKEIQAAYLKATEDADKTRLDKVTPLQQAIDQANQEYLDAIKAAQKVNNDAMEALRIKNLKPSDV